VEKRVPPELRTMGNNNDKTPKDILIITFYDKFQNIKIARDLHHMILIC